MPEPFFNPTFPGAAGPIGPTPGAKTPAPVPTGGPSFGEELSQALDESQPQGASEMKVEATDQRLNELRADLNLVRQRATQLQAFQAQAAQLYQAQARS
ncbi:MAG: hypothetical protein QF437_00440 [Planctomycetota bacterium]|nr:hypothetical protein [Planctomycetota bacterium]MDP7247969.1 hypothetical protein [Planctomycetota bacterium]|tara:strand:- start:111 stop:407 length:297 start_codon:yes stop_codon:yes gene_type:complete